jgi:hypothetical protein
VSPKRGDRVAPPARPDEYELRFGTNDAAKGAGRIWCLINRDTRILWLVHAGPGHPKATDR